eukprot:819367-Prymnesium_polylepis.2
MRRARGGGAAVAVQIQYVREDAGLLERHHVRVAAEQVGHGGRADAHRVHHKAVGRVDPAVERCLVLEQRQKLVDFHAEDVRGPLVAAGGLQKVGVEGRDLRRLAKEHRTVAKRQHRTLGRCHKADRRHRGRERVGIIDEADLDG